jgi:DNA-binding transcriptional LysR family regulator
MHYLDEVAREGSIRRAAERINVSASAVNRQILNLEEQLGVALFERQPRGVKLTEAGKIILDSIRRYNRDIVLAMAQIDDLRDLRRGHVAIGTLLSLSEELIPDVLAELRGEYPDISYSHYAGNSEDIVRQVAEGSLDIGLCWDPPASTPVLRATTIELETGVLLPMGHPLARAGQVKLSDCLDFPCIFPARGSEIRYLLDRINTGIGMTISPAIETNSIQTAKRLAVSGQGIAFMPALSAASEIRAGQLIHRPLSDPGVRRLRLAILSQNGRELPSVANMLLARLEQRLRAYLALIA